MTILATGSFLLDGDGSDSGGTGWEGKDRDGTVQISGGRITMERPRGMGKWPVVQPGTHVQLYYDQVEIKEPAVISDPALIEATVLDKPPHNDFDLFVSADKTEVYLETSFVAGKKYALRNSLPAQKLKIDAEIVDDIQPDPIDPYLVMKELQEMNIRASILEDVINEACSSRIESKVVVARGRPAVPAKDGVIEYLCSFQDRLRVEPADEMDPVDIFDRGVVNSVEAGTVLARFTPPVPGKAGTDVFGKSVMPKPPANKVLPVGPGVQLIDEGRIAVAAIDGRPSLKGRKQELSVISRLTLSRDADLSTGHIDFKGDVLISGDVTEGISVNAGGSIEIKGNIFHANVTSGSNIAIHQKVVGGHVQAGGHQAILLQIFQMLTSLLGEIEKLLSTYNQVIGQLSGGKKGAMAKGKNLLFRELVETKFSSLCKNLAKLKELALQLPDSGENFAAEICRFPAETLTHRQAENLLEEGTALLHELERGLKIKADVLLDYCQNTLVEATGNIIVTDPLAYNSKLCSGENIEIHGECRGGCLSAKHKITAAKLGSEMGVKTLVQVDDGGIIRADMFYPNVWLVIGGARYQIQETSYKLEWRFDKNEGEWKRYSIY